MLMVLVKECKNPVCMTIHSSPFSIEKREDSEIYLNNGLNILDSIEHGFYFKLLSNSHDIAAISLKDYDTSNIVDMSRMFVCCLVNNLNLSNFDTRNVTDMYSMFRCCENLVELDLSSFDTSKVLNMTDMFYCCSNLQSLDLSNFDISNVTMAQNMFYGCYNLKRIRCKRSFKEWCLEHKYLLNMPYSVRRCTKRLWDIID